MKLKAVASAIAIIIGSLFLTGAVAGAQTHSVAQTAEVIASKHEGRMPKFRGNLAEYLGRNMRYPDSARNRNEEGRAVVQFRVNVDGRVDSVFIVKSSGFELLDNEALRVIETMKTVPRWKPGREKRKPVAAYFTLPMTFRLID